MASRSWAIARSLARYGLAIVLVIMITAAGYRRTVVVGEWVPVVAYILAVLLAAVVGGTGPSILATILGALALDLFFMAPLGALSVSDEIDQIHLCLYLLAGALIAVAASQAERLRRERAADRSRLQAMREAHSHEAAQAEATRRVLEQRFRAVFDSQVVPLAIMRCDGAVLEANDAMLRLFGATREQLGAGALSWAELTPPEWRAQAEENRSAVKRNGSFGPVEKEYVRLDGSRVPVIVAGASIPNEEGANVVFAIDVSERKRMERALRQSESRLRRLWESNILGVVHSDAAGAIVDANDFFLRLVGYTRADLESGRLRWSDLTPPEYAPLDARGIAEANERGACTPYQKAYLHRDGREVPVLLGYARLEGTRDQYICFVLDLTEQKRAEAALAEEVTKAITDHASAAIFMLDEQGRCTFMNPSAEALTGFTFAELAHRSFHDAVHHHTPDGRPFPSSECQIKRVVGAGEALLAHQDVYFHKSGEAFPVICSASRIMRPGRPPALLLEVRDVTEQARIAAEREALLDSERAARAELSRAMRAKDEFVAMLSHELRTPLNAVLGWAGLARRPGQSQEQVDRALGIVERNGRALAQIMSDLLDVSRIATGKLHLDLAPIDLAAVVETSLDAVRSAAESKRISLRAAIDHDGAVVLGDAARLQQVVWNLVSNAIKFTPEGGRVHVSLARRDGRIALSVRDTGQGIGPELLPLVFERYRQAEASAARPHGGLGLGLAIVKHIVDLHGGSVRAESAGPGRGACFTVELARHVPIAEHEVLVSPPPSARLTGARILVVDDEPDAQELVKRLLEEQGAAVVTASSGAEALDLITHTPLDAVVSDVGMPGLDGYEMMRRVRTGAHPSAVPAVAVTAYARPEDRERAIEAGFSAHVAKPVDPAEMLATVAGVLSQAP
jgi:PAS domain S-box-containing protein